MSGIAATDFIFVPVAVAGNSVGFSIDYGGSAIKLVYRSKEDYKSGECVNAEVPEGKCILRLVTFKSPDIEAVVEYLDERCDISSQSAGGKVHCTGVSVTGFDKVLRERFGVEIQCEIEFDMFFSSFRYLFSEFPRRSLVEPPQEENIKEAKEYLRPWLESRKTIMEQSACGFADGSNPEDDDDDDDDLDTCDVTHSVLAQMGSTVLIYKLNSDWSGDVVDIMHTGGRSFLGVGNAICGETKTFDELVRLNKDLQRQTAVNAYFSSEKLLPFTFA